MKKFAMSILAICILLTPVSALGSSIDEQITSIESQINDLQTQLINLKKQKEKEDGTEYISKTEYQSLFTDASPYEGKDIQIAGKMFNSMEQDDEYKYFQMFYDLNGEDKSVVVACRYFR